MCQGFCYKVWMQPKIVVSRDKKERDQNIWKILEDFKIKPDNLDLLKFEDEKIGILQVKLLIKHLSTKPFGQTIKSAVILNGNNISHDAQNALLKILEEPPLESIILIGVDSDNRLLPTILSRCLVVCDQKSQVSQSEFNLEEILNKTVEERFEIIEKTSDKEKFLEDLTQSYRKGFNNPDVDAYYTPRVEFLEELLQAQIWKESNVNIRTILEYLMLKLPT